MANQLIRLATLLVAALLLAVPASGDIRYLPKPGSGGIVVATAGQSSLTGSVAEQTIVGLRIPANTMGKNGSIQVVVLWTVTNNSNNKQLLLRFNQTTPSTAGQGVGNSLVLTTVATAQTLSIIHNTNATNAQQYYSNTPAIPFGSAGGMYSATVDTTQDCYVNINGQLAVGTDTITVVHAYAVVYPAP